jgi:three-Cys-motif partner protein
VVALPRDPSELPPPLPDGRILHPSKSHSYEKLYYWSRVLQEYATRTKYQWAGRRVCIDLFASCGIWEDSETKELGWGSPLLALHAIDPFDVYIFGELDPVRAKVLAERVDESGLVHAETVRLNLADPEVMRAAREFKGLSVNGPKCAVITGDANDAVPLVKLMMPAFERRRMVLTMLDPYGVCFDWDSLAGLALHERIDCLIYFPEDIDLERNWRLKERTNRYMPTGTDWQTAVNSAPRNRGRIFREIYEDGLKRQLGLKVGVPKPIRARGREIYKLLYASPHEKGLEVWEHARRVDPGGQIEMYLA